MIPVLIATFGAVFVAEIVGDKLLYTTGVLATRYRVAPVMCGLALAFMGKMAVAVMVGKAISNLPPWLIAIVTSLSFVGVAIALWRKPIVRTGGAKDHPASKAAMVTFTAIFFSEWGDIGQITAATMAARFGAPFVVWTGAVLAMVTKGALAVSLGAGARGWIREHLSPRIVQYCGVTLLLVLGALSVMETLVASR
jgi:putative Ca2+/H+ antiporter (TMEM165/GDT1 family)